MKSNGAILWEGASLLDGKPIVAIVTGLRSGSTNRKTGSMLQTWILRADVEPHTAIKTGADASICGDCPHRGTAKGDRTEGRACYVLTHNAPLAIFRGYKREIYPRALANEIPELGAWRSVRLGAYGDPAAVPAWVWRGLTKRASNWTGYTHRWRSARVLQSLCMASVDNPEERAQARAEGWRCFYVAPKGSAVSMDVRVAREQASVICPASEERGKRTTCTECGLCRGTSVSTAVQNLDIVIGAHGAGAKHVKA
ncbi:MAG: hypothetical protein V3S83_12410 [Gemmatimonadota bacterium]